MSEKDVVDIAGKRAKNEPKFVSQSVIERELALQYIGELKQQRGSSLHCKICSPVRNFTAPTTLLSHNRTHVGNICNIIFLNKKYSTELKFCLSGIKPYECRLHSPA